MLTSDSDMKNSQEARSYIIQFKKTGIAYHSSLRSTTLGLKKRAHPYNL